MATTDDTRQSELRACVDALEALPALLKPYTEHGTKLRVPQEIGGTLIRLLDHELGPILNEVHFAGVNYDYDEETRRDIEQDTAEVLAGKSDRAAVLRAAGDPIGDVETLLGECKALADVLQIATEDNPTLLDDSVTTVATILINKVVEAEKRLGDLWVAIGGKRATED